MNTTDFQTYVALDLETTGVTPGVDKIIEVGAIRVEHGKVVDTFESFVHYEGEIDPVVSIITGIKSEDLVGAPTFLEIFEKLKDFIGDLPMLGHNIQFDFSFLCSEGMPLTNTLWDTHQLAIVLLRHLRSYGLEALTKRYGISHSAHRALADAQASHEIWQILLSHIASIDPSKRSLLADSLVSSEWALKDIWSSDLSVDSLEVKPISLSDMYADFDIHSRDITSDSLFVSCFGVDLPSVAVASVKDLLAQGKRCIVTGGQYYPLERMADYFDSQGVTQSFLDHPSSYMDWNRFRALLAQDTLSQNESILVSQVLLHSEEGESVHKGSFRMMHGDMKTWNSVAGSLESEDFRRMYEGLGDSSLVFMTQHSFLHHVAEDDSFLSHYDHLVCLDPEKLEANATYVWGTSLSSHGTAPELSEFFDAFRKWSSAVLPDSPYPESILLHDDLKRKSYGELLELGLSLNHPAISAFFDESENNISWFKRFPSYGDVQLHTSPKHVDTLFRERVLSRISHVLIGSRGFCKELIGFDGDIEEMENEAFSSSLTLVLPASESIKGTSQGGDMISQMEYFLSQLSVLPGRSGFLFGSRHVLKKFAMGLEPTLTEKNIPFIAEGVNGGKGKMVELYEDCFDDERVVFLATYRFLPLFEREDLQFHQMYFHGLPFDPPGDPVTQVRSALRGNSFMDYALPKAISHFMVLLNTLTLEDAQKHIFLLDPHVQKKSYFEHFLAAFPERVTLQRD